MDFSEKRHLHQLFYNAMQNIMRNHGYNEDQVTRRASDLARNVGRQPWRSSHTLDFDDLLTCCAYLKLYAGCHASVACAVSLELFRETTHLTPLLNKTELHVVSVGGGPGNDLIGFCSAFNTCLSGECSLTELRLTVLDLKTGWEEILNTVMQCASTGSYGRFSELLEDIETKHDFVECDLTETENKEVLRSADIVIMTKVLSWINDDEKSTTLKGIYNSMKPGAFFMYIDNEVWRLLRPHSNGVMEVLLTREKRKYRTSFRLTPGAILRSSYGICLLQKKGPFDDCVDLSDLFIGL